MFRWIFVSLLLSAGGIAAVWMFAPTEKFSQTLAGVSPAAASEKQKETPSQRRQASRRRAAAGAAETPGPCEVCVFSNTNLQEITDPIIIPDGELVIVEKQVVPSAKEGIIKFIGTFVEDKEVVPPERRLPKVTLGFLAIPVGPNDKPREGDFQLPDDPKKITYRRVQPTDDLKPNEVQLFQETRTVRKLEVGDFVRRGQLLALVDPQKQLDEVAMKLAKLNAAEVERAAAEKQENVYFERYQTQFGINRRQPGTIGKDALLDTWMAYKKHESEKDVKKAEIVSAQSALRAAVNDLEKHAIHAVIDGVIKVIYKHHQGEAVKPFDPVMEIQNPGRLRVKARLEVQETPKLKVGMKAIVEASRPVAPRLVLSGHLLPVTCVAVSKGKRPVIVSGSEDETLRGWDSLTGSKLWEVNGLPSAVRCLACTPPKSERNLACFGCADGSIRLLDLDNPEQKSRELAERHRGPVLGAAFSPDGETIATCSDDTLVYLWKTETGALLHTLANHTGAVTSVQFASATRLVSAGKDRRLVVWDVEAGKPPRVIGTLPGRGGEVLSLGVSPDGQTVLFDQGKELRLLSLQGKQIVGSLQNPSDAMNFSTMALFSPDGKTILTNGSAPGKLQLWRTPATQSRGSELRQFIWNPPSGNGIATCGAFAPEDGAFAVTGTQDHKVLVWTMPSQKEIDSRLEARLTLVEQDLDTQTRHVRIWAELDNPGWLIPGMGATMVVLPPRK